MNLSMTGAYLTTSNKLIITGVPTLNASRFSINIGSGEQNIALHFDVRFNYGNDHRTIVLNNMRNGSFGTEKKEKHFFFQEGKEFKITITFNSDEFQITIPDNYNISFPNSFDEEEFKFIQMTGNVRLKSFNFE